MFNYEFYVYIITNRRNGTLYTGHTDDLGTRMGQHSNGVFDGFSKKHGLKHLVWFESYAAREDAFKRERQIKEWKRAWKLELIEKENPHWIDIIESPMWPLPEKQAFPELWAKCMACRLDPSFKVVD